jgi:hypothetical protein
MAWRGLSNDKSSLTFYEVGWLSHLRLCRNTYNNSSCGMIDCYITTIRTSSCKRNVGPVLHQLKAVPWRRRWEWRYSSIILNLGTRWRWVVRCTCLFIPRERAPGTQRVVLASSHKYERIRNFTAIVLRNLKPWDVKLVRACRVWGSYSDDFKEVCVKAKKLSP